MSSIISNPFTALVFLSLLVATTRSLSSVPATAILRGQRPFVNVKSPLLRVPSTSQLSATEMNTAQENVVVVENPSFPLTVWRFSRPHTLIGSFLAIPSLHALASPSWRALLTKQTAASIVFATIPSLLINIYITGLNQVTDVEIDRVNKPYLPIAAGYLSISRAVCIITACLALGLSFSLPQLWGFTGLNSDGLAMTLLASAALGTAYSLPPFRLKRFPFMAAFCITAVRGAIVNVGFYCHAMSVAYGKKASLLTTALTDSKCALSSLFFGIFGIGEYLPPSPRLTHFTHFPHPPPPLPPLYSQ